MEILNNVIDYVRSKNVTYALMITGEWGSGKTYFWKNKVTNKIKDLTIEGSVKESDIYTVLYITLNGIEKIEQLERNIYYEYFLQQYLSKDNKDGKKINHPLELTKMLFSIGNKVIDKYSGVDFLEQMSKLPHFQNLNNVVICFDDLERSKIKSYDIFAYLNKFVEHDNVKIIFLTNEEKFYKNENENDEEEISYKDYKEKIIGRTLQFRPNVQNIVQSNIEIFDGEYKQFLKIKK
ncbi:P-loop NTPase fold protein [Alkalicoccobacillus plakortidis]|uniref:KAP family NTPase n=1 Tax=Alkalicoccobacillus plakortidis TaxID=444060 RepID=A0ABT0XJU6_9BACI|nr:P-loop NTPase fold protein [Alkalicoccobacillus plakortidis]MCM2675492.1 KAP family NTPase [Alkalicoccobacillus plakortidis]